MSWPKVRLGDVATYINGFAFKPTDWGERGSPIIRIQDLTGTGAGAHRFDGVIDEKYRVSKGDVLVSWSASLDAFIWDGEDAWLNQHIFKVRFDKAEVDVGYFYHQVRYLLATLRLNLHGATMRHLTKPNFDALPFVLPPLAEQKKIVEKVEKALKRVDALKAQFERMEKSAADYFKAALAETFAAVKGEKVKLDDVCEKITKGTTPTSVGFAFETTGVNFVKIETFAQDGTLLPEKVAHISPECHAALARSQLQDQDVLFSIAGALGRVAVVDSAILPANTNQALAIIRLNRTAGLDPWYLRVALQSDEIVRQCKTMKKETAQANLSLQNVADFLIVRPSVDTQRTIVSDLDAAKAKSPGSSSRTCTR